GRRQGVCVSWADRSLRRSGWVGDCNPGGGAGHRGCMSEGDRRRRLEQLFDEHAAAVRAYALRRIDSVSAEDTVSEVFVVACRRIDEVPSDSLPWLLACARRVLANQHRGARRRLAL